MKQEVINSIARDYQHHMSLTTTTRLKGVQKLLKLTHITSQNLGLGGSTHHYMILVVRICYNVLTLVGSPYPIVKSPIETTIGASLVMNVRSQHPNVHLDLQIQPAQMLPLHPPRVYVGIVSLGLTPIFLATWRTHNRFELN